MFQVGGEKSEYFEICQEHQVLIDVCLSEKLLHEKLQPERQETAILPGERKAWEAPTRFQPRVASSPRLRPVTEHDPSVYCSSFT